ncbi:MAG: choice-of-anchor Q domain-containing protein [Dokdonella sp.]
MKSLTRLRRQRLAACLGSALAIGAPEAVLAHIDSLPQARTVRRDPTVRALSAPVDANARGAKQLASAPSVSNCNDSGAGSLRDAVAAAASDDTINLSSLVCSTITLTSGAIPVIVTNLTISGPISGALTLDGGGTDRVFSHTGGGQLTLQNLTLTHGLAADKGGCVYSSGSVKLQSSHVTECTVEVASGFAFGGGIYTHYDLDLEASTIAANSVRSAVAGASGGGVFAGRTLTAHASSISGNSAGSSTGSYGGGAYAGRAYVDTSTIDNNYAHFGGGIHVAAFSNGVFHISNSTISNNSAYQVGGLDTWVNGDFQLRNSTIAFNCAAVTHGLLNFPYGIGLNALSSSPIDLQSSIIANNTICTAARPDSALDVGAYDLSALAAVTGANNLVTTSSVTLPPDTLQADPMLAALADRGGLTLTLALLSGSPAIDAGNNAGALTYDQRGYGYTRTVGSAPDIGAYEIQSTGVTHAVSNCADAGPGSLRDVLAASASGDAVDLTQLACTTITLTTGALQVPMDNLELHGPGASALTIDANQLDRAIEHSGHGVLRIAGLTFENGLSYLASGIAKGGCLVSAASLEISDAVITRCQAIGYNGYGGAIYAQRLSMVGSTVSASGVNALHSGANAKGGGIFAASKLDMLESTVDGNTAPASPPLAVGVGGGIFTGRYASVSIVRSTISANQAVAGGGMYLFSYDVQLIESTISGNHAGILGNVTFGSGSIIASTIANNTCSEQNYQISCGLLAAGRTELQSTLIFGNITNGIPYDVGGVGHLVGANNLIGAAPILVPPDTLHDDPLLGPLQDNGGPTLTHALLPGSPAVDHGNNVRSLAQDQRGIGFARVIGAAADIGAFEAEPSDDVVFKDGFDGD